MSKVYNFVIKPIKYPEEVITNDNKYAISHFLSEDMKASNIPENEVSTKSASGVMYQSSANRNYILGVMSLLKTIDYDSKQLPALQTADVKNFNPSPTLRLYIPI